MSNLDSKHYVWVGGKEYEIDFDTLVDWIKSGKIGPNDWSGRRKSSFFKYTVPEAGRLPESP
jgi:hypothetical protein